ncbi:xanthine dehydrogenase family protein subunit M [Candidatus Poribacteria bacterium]|nr:xanthine dehydrogenase family protein subunit M [Candidatus Poribacteria bacterium]MYA72665.1 xanthine dehydrogenase family protein subunit M [Candidatus Poribacteria bacterium]MYH82575.1 xanthine dehydrogenase family protein subunit M [Candidatus Poribacteria bacterium]MYK95095.1 xanthine dehydrogenase family protein subunit M [Candidatus Poribacteria bacterium]
MKSFEFYEPTTLAEASRLFAEEHAQLLAGGTDIIIGMKALTETPQSVVSLQKIPGLDGITTDGDSINIGAMTTVREVELSGDVQQHHTALAEGASEIGSIQIRNLATIGGNIAHASPAADTVAGLLVADAQVDIASADGERSVPIDELFTGPGQTVLTPGEIITRFRLPSPASGSHYIKHKIREVMDLAFIGVAAAINMDNGTITDARIGLAAVAPTPIRATEAEDLLKGNAPTPELLEQAGEAAAAGCSPISDLRCSAEHRREMVDVLTRRTLQYALERASA